MRGDLTDSESKHRRALTLLRDLGDRNGGRHPLEGLARVVGATGRYQQSAWLFGAAEGLSEATANKHAVPQWQALNEPVIRAVRVALGQELFAVTWESGRRIGLDRSLDLILADGDVPSAGQEDQAPTRGGADSNTTGRLSAREREVAVLVAQGYRNREIAEMLVVSERTAETHVRNIREKLGLRSRAQIASWATERGLTRAC